MSSPRLHSWIERCQRFASTLVDGDAPTACRAFVELAATAPCEPPLRQRAIVRALLDEAWTRLLARLTGGGEEQTGEEAVDPRVVRAAAAIASRFADSRFHLQTLARELGVSTTHLTQLLKRDTGATFGGHLHARRIAEARALLSESALSVKEIAARVGYSSSSQLDRHFKRRVRLSPSAFRERLKRTNPAGGTVACTRLPTAARRGAAPTQTATLPQK